MAGIIVDPSTPAVSPPPEDGYITEDPQHPAGQKYLALDVPDFKTTGTLVSGPTFHSYVCLGSASEWFNDNGGADPSKYGQMLANLVTGFCDDDRQMPTTPNRSTFGNYDPTLAPQQGVDDNANGEVASPTEFPTEGTGQPSSPGTTAVGTSATAPVGTQLNPMQQESALLQLKGGWRDHTDGNRITTTYGDKVEVIRGNYKLLVLGRQDWPEGPDASEPTSTWNQTSQSFIPGTQSAAGVPTQVAGWDVSGGLVTTNPRDLLYGGGTAGNSGFPPPPSQYAGQAALMTQYTWEQNSDGNWGWTRVTQTGSAPPTNNVLNQNLGNGRTISYTWVDDLYEYIGSPAAPPTTTNGTGMQNPDKFADGSAPYPVQNVYQKMWANSIFRELNATAAPNAKSPPLLSSTMTSEGDMSLTTLVGDTSGSDKGTLTIVTTAGSQKTTNKFGNAAMAGWAIAQYAVATGVGTALTLGVEGAMPDQVGASASDTAGLPNEDAPNLGTDPAYDEDGNPVQTPAKDALGQQSGYFGTGEAGRKDAVGAVGKLGPTVYGWADGGVVTSALSESTEILGPASRTTTTYGTNSTSNYTIGSLSNSDMTLGTRSTTSLSGVSTDIQIAGALSASIKVALSATEFDIALSLKQVVFAANAVLNDLCTRVINQAPSATVNYLNLTLAGVNKMAVHEQKADMASMHTFGSLLHLLF